MTPAEVSTHLRTSLCAFEALPAQHAVPGLLIGPALELARLSDVVAARLVSELTAEYPSAGPALLEAMVHAARSEPRLLAVLVRLLWQLEGSATQGGRDLGQEIAELLPRMSPELRSVVFHCSPDLRDPARWREGSDYVRLDRSDVHGSTEPERWASSHSVQGQRERLAVLGYLPDGRDGPWDVPDRAAVTIFQFDHGFEATGALDERSTQELDSLAWGTFYLGNGRE